MKATYLARIWHGRIHVSDHRSYEHHIKALEGQSVKLSLEPAGKKRSQRQNDYYWAVVVPLVRDGIFDATGDIFTHEEVHEFLKGKYNTVPVVNKTTGEVEHIARSTANLKVPDFMAYLIQIKRFATEYLGITIPDPNEQVEIRM